MAQEFEFEFIEGFNRGLRDTRRTSSRKQAMLVMSNLEPADDGGRNHEKIPYDPNSFLQTGSNLVTNGTFASDPFAGDWTNSGGVWDDPNDI